MTDSLPNPIEQAANLNQFFIDLSWKTRIKITHPNERDWNIQFLNSNVKAIERCDFDGVLCFLLGIQACLCLALENINEEE